MREELQKEKMVKFAVLFLFLVQSCTEVTIGTIVASSVLFSRYDSGVFNSRLIRKTKSDINAVLRKNNCSKNSIEVAQDGNSIYVIGFVRNGQIKTQVLDAISQKLGGAYIDEIAISSGTRNSFQDSLLALRLKHHLIFTKNLKSQNYQVFVFNKKAYIVGRTSGKLEKELLIKSLEGVLYVEDVVIYIT